MPATVLRVFDSYGRHELNFIFMKQFKLIDADIDFKKYQRTFSGRMTKARFKALDRFCRKNSFRSHCGHEWDCCGCLSSQCMEFSYSKHQVIVTLTIRFNY